MPVGHYLAVVVWCVDVRGHGCANHYKEHSVRHRSSRDQGLECMRRPRLHVARRRGCPSVSGAFQGPERARRHLESFRAMGGLFVRLFNPRKRDHGASHNFFSGHTKGHGVNLQIGKRGSPLCFALRALASWNNTNNVPVPVQVVSYMRARIVCLSLRIMMR